MITRVSAARRGAVVVAVWNSFTFRDWADEIVGRRSGGSHLWSLRLGEERELAKQLVSRGNEAFCDLNGLFCFVCRGRVSGYVRIFQLVAAPSKVCKRPETLPELGSDRALYGVVTSAGSSAQALLCHERDAGEPCGVVGQDVSAVGIVKDYAGSRRCRLSCLCEQRGAVGSRAGHQFQFPPSDELLYLGLASRPSTHRQDSRPLGALRRCCCRLAREPLRTGQTGSAGREGQPLAATHRLSGSLG